MHYVVSARILVICFLLVSAKQVLGNPISCLTNDIAQQTVDAYCWSHSNRIPITTEEDKNIERLEINYIQFFKWIYFVLVVQAFGFYFPHFLWKNWEGGRMKDFVLKIAEKPGYYVSFKNYMDENVKIHKTYFCRYFFCEIVNAVFLSFNIVFMHCFLNGEFFLLGFNSLGMVLSGFDPSLSEHSERIFPKTTSCTFQKMGQEGEIRTLDSYCVISANVLNEILFAMLSIWYFVLIIFSGVHVISRVITIISRCLKIDITKCFPWKIFSNRTEDDLIWRISHDNYGYYFVLRQLRKNINSIEYHKFIESLAKLYPKVEEKTSQELNDDQNNVRILSSRRLP